MRTSKLIFSIIFCLGLILGSKPVQAQRNGLQLELGGVAGHYSLNYERMLGRSNGWNHYLGIGFSPKLVNVDEFSPRIPIQFKLGYQNGTEVEFIMGVAFTPYWHISETRGYVFGNSYTNRTKGFQKAWFGRVGFRWHPGKRNTYLGAYYTPGLDLDVSEDIFHWGAVNLGWKF